MPGDAKYNWKEIRQRYIGGEWLNLTVAAQELGIAASYLRARAGRERWSEQRATIELKSEEEAKRRILGKMTREFEKRLQGMLDSADVLRFKALKTLGDEKTMLTGAESIKALLGATDIEREIFLRRGKPIGNEDSEAAPPPDTVNPGVMARPTTLSEITDEQLLRIIDIPAQRAIGPGPKPAKSQAAKQPLERKPAPATNGNNPSRGRSGGTKTESGEAGLQRIRKIHIQRLQGKLAPQNNDAGARGRVSRKT